MPSTHGASLYEHIYMFRKPTKAFEIWSAPGSELSAGMDLQKKVEDHHPGLHPFTTCREHEEAEPGSVQHVGLRSWICPAASHPGEQFLEATPHGCQLQETTYHARWCQQHIPQQVGFFHLTYKYILKGAMLVFRGNEHACEWEHKGFSLGPFHLLVFGDSIKQRNLTICQQRVGKKTVSQQNACEQCRFEYAENLLTWKHHIHL